MIQVRRFWQLVVVVTFVTLAAPAHPYEPGQEIGLGGLLCDKAEQVIRVAERADDKDMPLELSIKDENKLHPNACVLVQGPEFYVRFEGIETIFSAFGQTYEVHRFTILGIRESVDLTPGFAVTTYKRLEQPFVAYGYTQKPSEAT